MIRLKFFDLEKEVCGFVSARVTRDLQLELYAEVNPLSVRFDPEFFRTLPSSPGVYFFKNRDGEILYVGKAKNLKNRLNSYRYLRRSKSSKKTRELLEEIENIEWEICDTERLALIRENTLLQELRPPYNRVNTYPESYFFVLLTETARIGTVSFELITELPKKFERSQSLYGAFKNRERIRAAIHALYRLCCAIDDAAPNDLPRYFFKELDRYRLEVALPEKVLCNERRRNHWISRIKRYFRGTSNKIIAKFQEELLVESESGKRSKFLQWLIQENLNALTEFYELGSHRNRKIKKMHRLDSDFIEQTDLDNYLVDLRFESEFLDHS